MSNPKTVIPKGSRVLVTGATGFVASHIIQQFLERGYKVRGTVRDVSRASWIADEAFKSYADRGNIELVSISNMAADKAFDTAVEGVSAIIHVATVTTFDIDPNNVIPQTVASASSIFRSALKEPSVKRFVYTSTAGAAVSFGPEEFHVDRDTWNEFAMERACAPPPYGPDQGSLVYFASKVAAEKEVWKLAVERTPHFVTNVVSPGTVLGEVLHENYGRSTGSWVPHLYHGETSQLDGLPATVIVDVKDVALLHVAAALDPEVKNARLQAWGRNTNWNDVLAVLRKLHPQHQFVPDFADTPYLGMTTDTAQQMALLKKWGNQEDWRPLEVTLADNLVFTAPA